MIEICYVCYIFSCEFCPRLIFRILNFLICYTKNIYLRSFLIKRSNMAKNKDATNVLPVDTYRKQIGKQDYKKSKAELKESKARSQAKKGVSNFYQDIAIMIGAMVLVMGVLYAGLYLYLEKKDVNLPKL